MYKHTHKYGLIKSATDFKDDLQGYNAILSLS